MCRIHYNVHMMNKVKQYHIKSIAFDGTQIDEIRDFTEGHAHSVNSTIYPYGLSRALAVRLIDDWNLKTLETTTYSLIAIKD